MHVLRVICLLGLGTIPLQSDAAEKKPNVVVVFTDDQGYADVGCFGGTHVVTPHLDQMAREGRKFTDFYVAQAVCSASRTALLTGCYPNRVGILGALGPNARHGISSEETTLGEVFKNAGYATAAIGKWHLGHHPEFLPTRHGFDRYYGLPYSNDMWPKHPTAKFPDLPLIDQEQTIARNPDQSQLTTDYTTHAVKFIEDHAAEPFFVYLAHSMPHVPLFVSEKGAGRTGKGLFADVIAEIDESVGTILATLKRLNLDDNTLVIFTCDNGPWLSYGNHAGSALPLREGKGTSWDGGVRVPFIARWPGRIPAGTECHEPCMTIDLLPTLAKLAGSQLPERKIDGLDIGPLLFSTEPVKSPHEGLFIYWGNELHAVRSGDWKLHFPHSYRTIGPMGPGQDGKPKPYREGKTELALFNLRDDISQTKNVVADHPDVLERLNKLADEMRADLGDSLQKLPGPGQRPAGQLPPETPKN